MRSDEESMLICAVRYAQGRMTYVVTEADGWVKSRWSELSLGTKDVITRDLDRLLEEGSVSPRAFGMEMDKTIWVDLRNWIGMQP